MSVRGQTLPVPAPGGHVRNTSVSCRSRCSAANGRSVPKAAVSNRSNLQPSHSVARRATAWTRGIPESWSTLS